MGQLKPSEVRLLIIFCLTVLALGSFFVYGWYSKALSGLEAEKERWQVKRTSLLALRAKQNEFNRKRVWLNQYQPVARDRFEAKEALDRVMSSARIQAASLTVVSVPPEKDPDRDNHYWAFERRVVVRGGIESLIQWLVQLQSERSFRAVTHLHIFPKKKTEPETLTCEVTIEQWFGYPGGAIAGAPEVNGPVADPAGKIAGDPQGAANEVDSGTPPQDNPSTTGGPGEGNANTASPPDPGSNPVISEPKTPLRESPTSETSAGGEKRSDQVYVGTGTGVLGSVRRTRIPRGPAPPPPMASDLAAAEARGAEAADVVTGIEQIREAVGDAVPIILPEPVTLPVGVDTNPDKPRPRQPYQSISRNPIVGEDWDENTPGARPENLIAEDPDDTPNTN